MCYYNGVKVTRSEFIRLKQLEKAIAKLDLLNRPMIIGFDYSQAPVLKRIDGKEDFEITQMEWGFIPPYLRNREAVVKFRNGYKDANGKFHPPITTLNAVGEEMLQPGKMYRDAALNRRCLVLSTGFYEWRHVHPIGKQGKPLKTAVKYPYHIVLPGQELFFMAGIWQSWTDKDSGETVETFAIVTTAANKLMQQIHNSKMRMPLILTEDQAWEWLFGDLSEEDIKRIVAAPIASELMSAYTIAKDFRAMNDPATPFEYPELTPVEM
ncbi:MAG: SOS response-associated peptidase [Chitinophagaceae bacterium]|nr:SOS response-associated peptidase [Chitinophagaceae bacterium]